MPGPRRDRRPAGARSPHGLPARRGHRDTGDCKARNLKGKTLAAAPAALRRADCAVGKVARRKPRRRPPSGTTRINLTLGVRPRAPSSLKATGHGTLPSWGPARYSPAAAAHPDQRATSTAITTPGGGAARYCS